MGMFDSAKRRLTEQSGHFFEVKYKIAGIEYTEKVYGRPSDVKSMLNEREASAKKRKESFRHVSTNLKTK